MPYARTLAVATLCLFSLALSPASAKHVEHKKHAAHAARSEKSKAEKKAAKKNEPSGRMVASVYGEGNRVASGGRFDPNGMTVAHRTLPFGTKLLVYYGGSVVEVVVNDRGPFVRGRDIDLTRGVAKVLHFSGVGRVRVAYWPPLPPARPDEAPPRPVEITEAN
jgi:rare lipoprotein A